MAAKNQNTVVTATQKTEPGAKKDALATALAQIEKQFGKGAVMKLGDNAAMQVEAISTGSLGLDMASLCQIFLLDAKGRQMIPIQNKHARLIPCGQLSH